MFMNKNKNTINKKKINLKIGDIVKYINTGTIGSVIDIKVIDSDTWILIDSTNLYYNINLLELVNDKVSEKKIYINNIEKDIEEKILQYDEYSSSYTADNIDGPGGAG